MEKTSKSHLRYGIEKPDPELFWFIADRWFRMLEIALVFATIQYFNSKIDFIPLKVLHFVSLITVCMWIVEVVDSIDKQFFAKWTRLRKILTYAVVSMLIIFVWAMVVVSTSKIIALQSQSSVNSSINCHCHIR